MIIERNQKVIKLNACIDRIYSHQNGVKAARNGKGVRIYKNANYISFERELYQQFKTTPKTYFEVKEGEPITFELEVFYLNKRQKTPNEHRLKTPDNTNILKGVEDVACAYLGFNDAQIYRTSVVKMNVSPERYDELTKGTNEGKIFVRCTILKA